MSLKKLFCFFNQAAGSLEDTPLTMVTTLEQLERLTQELKNVKEFAIDLEVMSCSLYTPFLNVDTNIGFFGKCGIHV